MKLYKFKYSFASAVRQLVLPLMSAIAVLSVSCSKDDYINAIPANSIAVMSVDAMSAVGADGFKNVSMLKDLFKADSDCGLDFTSKIYLFESVEGNIGLVAKVSDQEDVESWLTRLSATGFSTKPVKRSDCYFSVVKGSWVAGFNSSVLIVMGPVVASQQSAMQQQIIKYIVQDEDNGLKSSPFYNRLDSIDAPVALVAQVAALPDKFAAPFTLGAPKDADASQVLLSAGISKGDGGCLIISGKPFSLNKQIDDSMRKSLPTLRPITAKYLSSMSADDALGAFLNVDGAKFIDMLHSNRQFMALLAGVNAAIDMDNIIKSVNGDMAIVMPRYTEGSTSLRMSAQLGGKAFLADVPYWKSSCPKGGRIDDIGKDFYRYTDGSMSYCFGVSADMQYYSGATPVEAQASIGVAKKTLPQPMLTLMAGKRLCMVFNLPALLGGTDFAPVFNMVAKPLLGGAEKVVYYIE